MARKHDLVEAVGPAKRQQILWGVVGVLASTTLWWLVTRSPWVGLSTLLLGSIMFMVLPAWLPVRSRSPVMVIVLAVFLGGCAALAWFLRSS